MTYTPSPRVRQIEANARQRFRDAPVSGKNALLSEAFFKLFADKELWERQARSYAHALINEPVVVFPEERIHGIIYRKNGADTNDPFCGYGPDMKWGEFNAQFRAERRVRAELPELIPYFQSKTNGELNTFIINEEATPGHIAWRWDWVLREGLEAIVERHRQASLDAKDAKARDYYQGVVICLEAILEWNRLHVAELERILRETEQRTLKTELTEETRRSLRQCLDVMRQVPAKPARSFHEALQSYHFMWLCAFFEAPYGGNSPGRFDYLLWPFLQREYEEGVLDDQAATDLVAETFIKCDEILSDYDGAVISIVTGGLTPELDDAVTPLSRMVIDAIESLDVTHPAVYNRISGKNPDSYRQRCLQYMLHGNNRAQFLNEEALLEALTRDGYMSSADAAMYICGGCMEINPQGLTSDLFWSMRYNICKTLELCLTGGIDLVDGGERVPGLNGTLADCPDFEIFYDKFIGEVRKTITLKFKALDIAAQEFATFRPQYVVSSMMADCFARGRNHIDGGARYADYGGSVIGIPNVANSLMAVKKAVFEGKFISAIELVAALRANFDGCESLRKRLRNLPKYGELDPEADAIMNRLLCDISSIFDSYRTFHGGRCKQVLLTFIFSPFFGASLGASPEGNLAGAPVAQGLTPTNVNTAISTAMGSYLSLDNQLATGGASTMWDMDAEWINQPLLDSIYHVFEDGGGQIFQGNMTDVSVLEKAMDNPEDYPDLIVRVGGFSARFSYLSREVRQEIIDRRRWK